MVNRATIFDKFLISRGGPFYELQRQLQLLHEDAYRARSRATLFVCLAWGGPLILSMVAGHAWGPFAKHKRVHFETPNVACSDHFDYPLGGVLCVPCYVFGAFLYH